MDKKAQNEAGTGDRSGLLGLGVSELRALFLGGLHNKS